MNSLYFKLLIFLIKLLFNPYANGNIFDWNLYKGRTSLSVNSKNITNLIGIDLSSNRIKTLTSLKNLKNLRFLTINSNYIKSIDEICDVVTLIRLH